MLHQVQLKKMQRKNEAMTRELESQDPEKEVSGTFIPNERFVYCT